MLQCRLGVETYVGVQTADCIQMGGTTGMGHDTRTRVTDGHCNTLPLVGHSKNSNKEYSVEKAKQQQ